MTTELGRPSAQIYEFPKGGRAALARGREDARLAAVAVPVRAPVATVGGWYHEAALCDADPSRKN